MLHALYILIVFMSFTGNQNDVVRSGLFNRITDGNSAINLDAFRIRYGRQNIVDDFLRIFQAWIVAGYDDFIRTLYGCCAHQGAFATISVTAAAKYAPQSRALRFDFLQSGECFFQCIGRVGVIDDDQRFAAVHNAIHAA